MGAYQQNFERTYMRYGEASVESSVTHYREKKPYEC